MSGDKPKRGELPEFIDRVMRQASSSSSPTDLTNLAVGLTEAGLVHVSFGKEVEWLALRPDQAEQFAAALTHYAREARARRT